MRRAASIAGLLSIALLAGCAAPQESEAGDDGGDGAAALPERELAWSLTGCRFVAGIVAAKASALAPHLPPGFRSLSMQELLHPSAPRGTDEANFGVEALTCQNGSGVNGTLESMQYGSYFSAVDPPGELRGPYDFHFVKWDVLVPDTERRELLAAYGVPARNGTAAFSMFSETGPTFRVAATLQFEGEGVSRLTATGAVPVEEGSFAEFTAVPSGFVAWSTKYAFAAGGVGQATVQAEA
jgi:hypothetical protein